MLIRRRKRPHPKEVEQRDAKSKPMSYRWKASDYLNAPKAVELYVNEMTNQKGVTFEDLVESLFTGIIGLLTHYRLSDISKATKVQVVRLMAFIAQTEEPCLDDLIVIYRAFGINLQLTMASAPTSLSGRAVTVES